MIPVVALGAAVVGGVVAAFAAKAVNGKGSDSEKSESKDLSASSIRENPSFIVTPVSGATPETLSAVEAVRKFTF